jgi:hypothetical protein
MKKTITYSSIIIATLLIGFIIGFLVNGRVTRHKIKKMRSEFTGQGFNRQFMRVLKPSPEQMEQLKPILKDYAQKHRETIESLHGEQEELFQGFKSEVEPYLTEEQIQRLEKMHKKRKGKFDHKKKQGRQPQHRGPDK